MDTVKIGFVGMRRGLHLAENTVNLPGVKITAICDKNPQRLAEGEARLREKYNITDLKTYGDFAEFLTDDMDAVVIATDATIHTPMAIQALEAGRNVLSEIPAIHSLEEAKALAAACKAHPNQKYMMAENCCFWAFINTWKSLIEQGQIGDIWYAEAEYLHNVTDLMRDENGNPTWRASYDSIRYLTHDLGPLLYIMNDRVVRVSGFKPGFNSVPDYSTGTPNEVGIFQTAKGALIKIFCAFGIERPMIHNYCIYGTKGTLETDRIDAYQTNAYLKSIPNMEGKMFRLPTGTGYPGFEGGGHGGADGKMIQAFVESVRNDTPVPIDYRLGINMSLPGIIAHESAVNGGAPLEIPEF